MKSFYLFILVLSLLFSGCGIVENVAGVGFDAEQFEKAREAKILELRSKSALVLANRLQSKNKLTDSDISITLDENFINHLLDKYESATGMLDEATNYEIKNVKAKIVNGASIVTLELLAHNETHNIDVQMVLDCLLMIESSGKDIVVKLEPFNISPVLTTKGVYSAAKEIINKLIKLNLANLNKNLPPLKIPLNIENKISIDGSKTDIKSKINLTILNPKRVIKYNLKIKEIIFFNEKVLIALDLNKIEAE